MQKKHIIITAVCSALVLIIAGGLIWLYTGQVSDTKESVFRKIPFPAALVNMKFVSAGEILERIDLTQKLGGDPSTTYDLIIEGKKVASIANGKDVQVTQQDIDEEYSNIVKQFSQGDENAFKDELQQTYGMTPEQFKSEVIEQELTQAQLVLWYNQQEDLSAESYKKAHELENKLKSGESFDEVAKNYTQDEATKDFAGDSGLIPFDDLLPEFREALQDAKKDDIKLIPSRYGLHILKVLDANNNGENGAKQIHLQQVFVQQDGFQDWLAKETENIRVIKLLNLS